MSIRFSAFSEMLRECSSVEDVMEVTAKAFGLVVRESSGIELRGLLVRWNYKMGGETTRVWGERAEAQRLLSGRLWRLSVAHGTVFTLDTRLGLVRFEDGEELELVSHRTPLTESVNLILRGGPTHLIGLPLLTPSGGYRGLVVLTFLEKPKVGQDVFPADMLDRLSAFASVFHRHLDRAELAPEENPDKGFVDQHLPVAGVSMQETLETLQAYAAQDEETIILTGPTGAGKSRLARWVHARSPRAEAAFESPTLVGRSPENQLAELVGWRKGAFTGAHENYVGAFARAEGGTLFLDEVDKLSLKTQQALLRLVDERTFRPLGGSADMRLNVRFVVGTNVDLWQKVREGEFLEDLFFRLAVLPLEIPALDARHDEIAAWAAVFAQEKTTVGGGQTSVQLSEAARRRLVERSWPGNLRQLRNVVRRATVFSNIRSEGGALLVSDEDVKRALAHERERVPERPTAATEHGALLLTADAIVDRALALRGSGRFFDLGLARGLRGVVLMRAADRLGNTADAYLLFGEESRVLNRNHHRDLNKATNEARALLRELELDTH